MDFFNLFFSQQAIVSAMKHAQDQNATLLHDDLVQVSTTIKTLKSTLARMHGT